MAFIEPIFDDKSFICVISFYSPLGRQKDFKLCIIFSILWLRKMRFKELKSLVQIHRAKSQGVNLSYLHNFYCVAIEHCGWDFKERPEFHS